MSIKAYIRLLNINNFARQISSIARGIEVLWSVFGNVMPVLSFLLVILVSIVIVRIGAVALEMTGLSKEVAAFQAQSAFSGVGFTTSESEYVVSHPVRRRIIRLLMLLGSAGITSAIATLVLSFVGTTSVEARTNLVLLVAGVLVLYAFSKSKLIDKILRKIIISALTRFTSIKVYDYYRLLGLSHGYTIGEIVVRKSSWLANKTLKELQLDKEGVLVLAIYRKGPKGKELFLGAPSGSTKILPGDILVCYGMEDAIIRLSRRLKGVKGSREHEKAIEIAQARITKEKIEFERKSAEI